MGSLSSPRRLLLRLSPLDSSPLPPSKPYSPPDLTSNPLLSLPPPPKPSMPSDSPPAQPSSDGSSPERRPSPEPAPRKTRFPRACTSRPPQTRKPAPPPPERRTSLRREKEERQQCARVVTPLVQEPVPAELPQWKLRSMWELASVLDFLHIFRPLLNIAVEFSAEELEMALISPNSTLYDVHMPLLRAIPPVTRMALGHATWVTVLCRKLKDWWHWVAEGDIPIVASHGAEVETYKSLDPATRLLILKAICDIRVEQDDIRNYIDNSLKRGIQLSEFRKERIGGDSYGVSYWYEDDPVIGHRLYREIRRVEGKKLKAKGSLVVPLVSYQWETVATNFDEFQEVSEKLFLSKNRTEASLGKKLKIDFLPEIEKIHKRKERLLKKQQREALLLDSYLTADGLSSGRSLRDRKPVTYTFDDYDRSINEAIKITKKRQNSPENVVVRRAVTPKPEESTNGNWNAPSPVAHDFYDAESPKSNDYEETDGERQAEPLDRSNRRRKRPQRYSEDFVEAVSDADAGFESDDDIVGEAVYDEEYLRSRKQQKVSSGSEEDEEYRWEEENADDDEEEEEEEYSLSTSEDTEEHRRSKKIPTRSRRATKLRNVDDLQKGLRRSKRATQPRINYRQYDLSDTDADSGKTEKSDASDAHSDATNDLELSTASQDQDEESGEEMVHNQINHDQTEAIDKEQQSVEKSSAPGKESDGQQQRRFLDLNELAPGSGFDDGPNTMMKGEDMDNS
ncbi:DDT domain-containing protein DDR4 [Typha latifolia]|uniref:DDT domain-containing protein DDR4 n=1 Tax=Typha latifolia TaxID=4733 RepID=UPI003C2B0152